VYALSRGIRFIRAVQTGAELNDQGLLIAEDLNKTVRLSERSSPTLQPALDALEADRNFDSDAPVLLLTGMPCERIKTRREHAFLVCEGARLPFQSSAPLIEIPEEE
jgi:hypothetical protein